MKKHGGKILIMGIDELIIFIFLAITLKRERHLKNTSKEHIEALF